MVWLGGTKATEVGGGAPARLCAGLGLTKLEQGALAGAGSRWEGGDAVAAANGRLSASWSWLWRRWRRDELGYRCGEEGGRGEVKGVLWQCGRC